MRESWLSSYSKASHTVLQHWLWRFLKKQTESFASLHKVFSKIKVDSTDSGTSAWTEIFLLYPVTNAGQPYASRPDSFKFHSHGSHRVQIWTDA